jgi:hypothetical protein
MCADNIRAQVMSQTINVDRFTRLKQTIAGKFAPQELPGVAEYLAGEAGEINYSMAGNLAIDLSGSQERRVKCIIYGWFLLFDPVTLAAVRHTLDIKSSLILVKDETELPPLETEPDGEDYIVCGTNMQVAERIEEEILLSLPTHAVKRTGMAEKRVGGVLGIDAGKSSERQEIPAVLVPTGKKISPFAKLAELKKK